MKTHKEVISSVLSQIKPSKEDVKRLLLVEKEILRKIKVPSAKPYLGGSGAKGTWLKDTHDIDIYVKFSYSKYSKTSEKLSDILEKSLKKYFSKITRIHGSRNYFQINYKSYTVEIVPILEIKNPSQAQNITDFSSFHVKYINSMTSRKKSLADEIRLAKVFAKANRFYGAESHIKGLSGYAVELLLSYYGSFFNFIKAAAKWKATAIIGNKKTAEKLNWAKKVSPLILIDPVQPERNAAAALSSEQYSNIINACRLFLKKPSEDLFVLKPVEVEKLRKKGHLIIINASSITSKKDVAGSKALKAFEHIIKSLQQFEVVDSFFDYKNTSAVFYIVTKKDSLPKEYKHLGPPIDNKKALEEFMKVNKSKIEVDSKLKRYYIMKKRINHNLKDHIKEILKHEDVTSRIKNISFSI